MEPAPPVQKTVLEVNMFGEKVEGERKGDGSVGMVDCERGGGVCL